LYICLVFAIKQHTKNKTMTKQEKFELQKLLYKIMTMGDCNSMIRLRFDKTKRKDWQKFMLEFIDKIK